MHVHVTSHVPASTAVLYQVLYQEHKHTHTYTSSAILRSPFARQPPNSTPSLHKFHNTRYMTTNAGSVLPRLSHPRLPSTARLSPTLAVTSRLPTKRHAVAVVPSCLPPSSCASLSISDSAEANAARNNPSRSSGGSPRIPVVGAALATYVWS